MPSGPERVQAALHEKGLDITVRVMPVSTRTAEMAAAAVGCEVGAIVKSLVFLADGEPVLVLCAGDRRVDTDKLGAMLGGKKIEKASAETVRQATGYAIGGVPPLGHATRLPTYMDGSLLRWEVVHAAAGAPETLFPIEPRALLDITGARLVEIDG